LGLSSNKVAAEAELERGRVLRALEVTRKVMARDTAEMFGGTVEVDETYLGGQWKNKRRNAKHIKAKRGRGTAKTPVFGILCRGGNVWAQIVPDTKAKTLLALIEGQVAKGSTVCSDTWMPYTGVAYRGYVHRTVAHGEGEYVNSRGNHINGLEGFWGYLKRQLAAKGGIRRERLALYLAEYVWKYNHRKLPRKMQEIRLLQLLNYQALNLNLCG
jgi:transposase